MKINRKMIMKSAFTLLVLYALFPFVFVTQQEECDKEKGCNSQDQDIPITLSTTTPQKSFSEERKERFQDINNLPPLNDRLYLLEDDELPQLLWWYEIYPHMKNDEKPIECQLGKCRVTNNRNELANPLTRGLIFYGTDFYADTLPLPRLPHHEWGLIHEESPKNQWMFSDELGISIFNHTATFRRESHYPISTFAMADPQTYFEDTYYISTSEKNRLQREENLAPAVFIQRNCNPSSDRDTYIAELMKYLPIDAYGVCLNNKEMPKNIDGFQKLSSQENYKFQAKYKFQIAFENAVCQDYMTEKFVRPLVIGSVPIYYGSPKAQDFAPSNKSVIMVQDFKSPKELAEYILMLNENDELYEEYLKHRLVDKKITNPEFKKALERQPWKLPHRAHKVNFHLLGMRGFSCHICDELHKRNNMLKEHLEDPTTPIKANKMGEYDHMGCPRPFPILPTSKRNRSPLLHFDYGRPEAVALIKMLQANETDPKQYIPKYLQTYTDKYPQPR